MEFKDLNTVEDWDSRIGINRNIMEFKGFLHHVPYVCSLRINRNIMEFKDKNRRNKRETTCKELIET